MGEIKYLNNNEEVKDQVIIDNTIYTGEQAKEIKKKLKDKETMVVEETKENKVTYLKG